MDGVQLPEGYSHFEEAAYFLPFTSQKFLGIQNKYKTKQMFENNKSLRAATKRQMQFWPRITTGWGHMRLYQLIHIYLMPTHEYLSDLLSSHCHQLNLMLPHLNSVHSNLLWWTNVLDQINQIAHLLLIFNCFRKWTVKQK